MTSLSDAQRGFHMEEYRQLRGEIVMQLARIENLLRYSLFASAVVYAWLIVQAFGVVDKLGKNHACLRLPGDVIYFGWSIPPGFVVLSGIIAVVTWRRMQLMADYIFKLERTLGCSPALGWEGFIRDKANQAMWQTGGFWLVVLAATLIASGVGLVITRHAAELTCVVRAR